VTIVRLTRRGFLAAVPVVTAACAVPTGPATPAPRPSTSATAGAPPTARPTALPTALPTAPTTTGGPARELVHATSGRPEVALTFHGAGDLDLARRILATLADRGAAGTVLAVGTWLAQYPEAARLVTGHGHELGNHTWSHPSLSALAEAGIRAEIERCRDRIAALTGGPGTFFRPSAAQHATPEVLRLAGAAGYATVLSYDVDSRDFTDPGATAIRRAVGRAAAGSVVSLHLGHPGTLDALPGLLDDLGARGLRPVTASDLFR
jgi:peptidoglycan/xylan/chitin deacetylase (PgdA/CDA1 family)